MRFKKSLVFALVLSLVMSILPISVVNAATDAMTEIESTFADFTFANTQRISDDGQIGIPVEVTAYYDSTKGNIKDGSGGTPIVMYVVNTAIERVGTKSDVEIISSMLNRGYVVITVDYFNNAKAVSPDLDWSTQKIREKILTLNILPSGNYLETFVVPAGYDVSLNNVYWEIDKHSAAGTLEYIVDVWNRDFRNVHGDVLIKWVDADGNQKATQNSISGDTPVWYNADGTENANGQYTYIKYTLAQSITDCVKKDGSPIDMNLYMHIIYPTSPAKKVPVMTLAGSGENLASVATTADRPQLNGFSFNGYAVAMYDYGYVPMARKDHYDYFDGLRGDESYRTGDNLTYSVQIYNDKTINTAAMRYLRYLADTDSDTYKFDDKAIGVYGNSKGGWMTFLGEEHPEELRPTRMFTNHYGETRLEAGESAIGTVIDAPEAQPWAGYDSGADLVYASCGYASEYITEGHAPTFIGSNQNDGGSWTNAELYVNLCREYNVPSLYTDAYLGHTFIYGDDARYGFDIYDAFFDFTGYYLKGDPVKVVYIDADEKILGHTDKFTVKFAGSVSSNEISKVTVKDDDGTTIAGTWQASYGDTEWTFIPNTSYTRGKTHTITVPATLKGDNGIAMGEAKSATFDVLGANVQTATTVENGGNLYATVNIPAGYNTDSALDTYRLTFKVDNDASNIADIYAVSNYNASYPASATEDYKVASINLKGKGTYSVDVTEYIKSLNNVKSVTLKVKPQKTAAQTSVYSNSLVSMNYAGTTALSGFVNTRENNAQAPDGTTALKISTMKPYGFYASKGLDFYNNPSTVFTSSGLGVMDTDDYGRKFHISFDVYDTISRQGTVTLNSYSSYNGKKETDFERNVYNIETIKDAWKKIEFDYVVSETDDVDSISKYMYVSLFTDGNRQSPFYMKNLNITETVSVIDFGGAVLSCEEYYEEPANPLETSYGTIPNTYESAEEYPFVIFKKGTGQFVGAYTNYGLSGAMGIARDASNAVVYLRRDYIMSKDTDIYPNFGHHNNYDTVLDLGGNTITVSSNISTGLIQASPRGTDARTVNIDVKNGTINVASGSVMRLDDSVSTRENTVHSEFNITFDNVNFVLSSDVDDDLIYYNVAPAGRDLSNNITYNNCTFDATKVTSTGVLFNAGNTAGTIPVKINVCGGQIKANDMSYVTVNSVNSTNSSVTFKKNSDGNYATILLPSTATAPSDVVTATEGKMAFTKATQVYANTEYSLEISYTKWIEATFDNRSDAIKGDYTGTKQMIWFNGTGSYQSGLGGRSTNDYAYTVTKASGGGFSAPYIKPQYIASYPVFTADTFTVESDVLATTVGYSMFMQLDFYVGDTKVERNFGLGSSSAVTYNNNTYNANTWYKIGATVDTATDKVIYLVNNRYVGEETIEGITGIGSDLRVTFAGSTAGTYAVDNIRISEGVAGFTYPAWLEATYASGSNTITGYYTGTKTTGWYDNSGTTNAITAGLGGKTADDFANTITKTGSAWAGPNLRVAWQQSYPTLVADKFTAEAQVYGGARDGENIFFLAKFVTETGTSTVTFGLGNNDGIKVKYNNGNYNAGEWYKLAIEGDSATDTVKYYVNGKYVGSTTVDGMTGISSDLRVQFSGSGKGVFGVDNMRIYQGEYWGDDFDGPTSVVGVYGADASTISGAVCVLNEKREKVSTIGKNCVAVFTDGEIYRYVPITVSASRELTPLEGAVTDYGITQNRGYIVENVNADEVNLYNTLFIWDSVNGKRGADFNSIFPTTVTGGTVNIGIVITDIPADVADEVTLTFSSDQN